MKYMLRATLAGAAVLALFSASTGGSLHAASIGGKDGWLTAQADTNRSGSGMQNEGVRQGAPSTATPSSSSQMKSGNGMAAGRIDITRVAAGMRADKVIGAQVYNSANESIGTIDDLIIEPNDRVVYAIVSVGGFLGVGDRLVAVPFERVSFQREDDKDVRMILADSTKAQLEAMPQFRYAR
jgi:sporulation protein YlmC with PRC-barrel domain